jgi:hypothetical protein
MSGHRISRVIVEDITAPHNQPVDASGSTEAP